MREVPLYSRPASVYLGSPIWVGGMGCVRSSRTVAESGTAGLLQRHASGLTFATREVQGVGRKAREVQRVWWSLWS